MVCECQCQALFFFFRLGHAENHVGTVTDLDVGLRLQRSGTVSGAVASGYSNLSPVLLRKAVLTGRNYTLSFFGIVDLVTVAPFWIQSGAHSGTEIYKLISINCLR